MVIGVKFKKTSKIYYFDPMNVVYEAGEKVIVETTRGLEYGTVYYSNREIDESEYTLPLKPVIRKATEVDEAVYLVNKSKEANAYKICKQKIFDYHLDMKLIDVEYTFDNQKLLFYFTSEQRVDFRELVKELATIFKTRIELRQIGVRDETKSCGGIGICGRNLCCNTFLTDFHTVSIKMAKDQNLSLNPIKISGICGRLMCCLQYENEGYNESRKKLPEVSDIVETPEGEGEVISVNILREQVKVSIKKDKDIREIFTFKIGDITAKKKCAPCSKCKNNKIKAYDYDEKFEDWEKPKEKHKKNNYDKNK